MMKRQVLEVEKIAQFGGHKDGLYSVVKTSNPKLFYTAGADGYVVEWNIDQPDQGKLVAKVPNTVYSMAAIEELNQLVVGQNNEGIHLLDLNSGKELKSLKLTDKAVFAIERMDDLLFVGTGDGWVYVVSISKWLVQSKVKVSNESVRSIAVDAERLHFWAGASDSIIRGYNIDNCSEIRELIGHDNSVFALTISTDGKFLLSGSRDAHMRVWNLDGFIETQEDIVAHMYTINDISFSPNGDYFATCSKDKSIKVWRRSDFRLLKVIDKARHAGHGTSVNRLLWLNNTIIVSVSDDHSASAWDVKGL
ncbi:WD40 repeat domain-containing protein [Flammeovirga sp. MY04]|uniref:WD40 repeat domain-containing protein n=1 Tax=Flammeovirga sp. MY04 TaxID=1191459 RepID=UPI00080630C7|nr:hypothetical protein [Flammeovirga sp. MY04]ANQ48274.1 WD40 repeat domain-containing protein [Flammeovirga sp. MY04]